MNQRPHCLDVLIACLERLETKNIAWTKLAQAHHDDMVAGRFGAMEPALESLDLQLLDIGEEEELRIRCTLELADELGLPDDPPPRLADLAALLPSEWAAELARVGRNLREAVLVAEAVGKRSSEIAKIGLIVSQGVLKIAQASAVRSMRPPAAYQRGGQKTTGTAVPVYQRAWRA